MKMIFFSFSLRFFVFSPFLYVGICIKYFRCHLTLPQSYFIIYNGELMDQFRCSFFNQQHNNEGSDAIRGLVLENAKNYCPNAKKNWKIKC